MGRQGLAPGEAGEIWIRTSRGGKPMAVVRVRALNGKVREVTAVGDTESAARRQLKRKLESGAGRSAAGAARDRRPASSLQSTMTVEEACEAWLQGRKVSAPRGRRAVRGQSLAGYDSTIKHLVIPHLGRLELSELTVGLLDEILLELEELGKSTDQARTVLNQVLAQAVRQNVLASNPMTGVSKPYREPQEVVALSVLAARKLLTAVEPKGRVKGVGGRSQNADLEDVVTFMLGTGMRIGEVLAVRAQDLWLTGDLPTVHVCGTVVEPRKGYVEKLHRQPEPKSRAANRRLVLPDKLVTIAERRLGDITDPDALLFASSRGTLLWPNNLRTRLRKAIAPHEDLVGTTPRTLRRTVGSMVAHQVGLDAARDVLGHSAPGVTFQHYVSRREVAPDVRHVLNVLFED